MNSTSEIPVLENVHILFSWYDYLLFSLMLGISALIGVYFGFFDKKQSTPDEYLMGGKKMKVLPIALSLIASAVSGTTLLAVPTDVYRFGATYMLSCISITGCLLITYFVYIPVFYKLQLTSTYEYLELRFNAQLRVLSSFLFAISSILYIPIVIYTPALAFSQATGTNLYLVAMVISITCIFYTTIGGLKAVVWTDTLQFFVMIGAIIWVFYMGIVYVGGVGEVFSRSYEGGRLDIDFDMDPTKRDTFFAVLLGLHVGMIGHVSIGQGYVQKYLALPTMNDVKKSLIWFSIGGSTIVASSVFTGLIIYAKYADCDPISAGNIAKHDQILPFYIMEISKNTPGLAGLFLSGIISASLSTLSAAMNCLSGTVYEDFISPFMPKDFSKQRISFILKVLVVIIGVIGTSLVFVIDKMGSILPIQFSLMGITSGPLVGLFTLGMLFPQANSKGAMVGSVSSLIIMSILVIQTQIYQAQGYFTYSPKPVSIEGCEGFFNSTILETVTTEHQMTASSTNIFEPLFIFRITYYYYAMIGTILVFIIALPVSYATRSKTDKEISKDLISPVAHWCMKENSKKSVYYSVEKAMEVVYPENDTNDKR